MIEKSKQDGGLELICVNADLLCEIKLISATWLH